jgi:hypothetical protein
MIIGLLRRFEPETYRKRSDKYNQYTATRISLLTRNIMSLVHVNIRSSGYAPAVYALCLNSCVGSNVSICKVIRGFTKLVTFPYVLVLRLLSSGHERMTAYYCEGKGFVVD